MKTARSFTAAAIASALAAALAALLSSCPAAVGAGGSFRVSGYQRSAEEAAESLVATLQCSPEVSGQGGERATQVGTTSTADLPIQNSGADPLEIEGYELYLRASDGSLVRGQQSVFSFAGVAPDFPLSIPAGGSYVFHLAFNPATAGVQLADLLFKTSAGDNIVRLVGRGAWILSLSVNAGQNGRIVSPLTVESGKTATYLAVEPTVELLAETTDPVSLTELQQWTVSGAGSLSSTTGLATRVTLTGAASVQAVFNQPYIFVDSVEGNDANAGTLRTAPVRTLARGISQFKAIAGLKGMALAYAGGSPYTMGEEDKLPHGLIRGGYTSVFSARPDDTTTGTFKPNLTTGTPGSTAAVIGTSSWHLIMDGSTDPMDGTTLLEGFTITSGANTAIAGLTEDRLSVAIAVLNGASPLLRSCSFIGGTDSRNSVGAYVYEASPSFDGCLLSGGTATEQGGRSVGLWCNFQSAPSLTGCRITGGSAAATYGKSYGLLNENYASSPVLKNCSIGGGGGNSESYAIWSAYGGQPKFWNNQIFTLDAASENWGLYLGSNGRTYVFSGNNIYNCSSGLAYFAYSDTTYTDIDAVNEQWVEGWADSYGYADNTSVTP